MPPHVMACMEVWGGNRAISNGVVMPGLDAWVYSRPYQRQGATEAGGDIHFVTSCATGRITRMIVADVSGHGAPVAKAAELLRRLMRKHSNYYEQGRLVEAVNAQFGEIAEATEGTAALFATAVVATYLAMTDELIVSNAGHPRPIRFDAGTGEWERVEGRLAATDQPCNLPLGVLEDTRYPEYRTRLRADDVVVFYSDSLIEAKDAAGRQLGEAGLIRMLKQMVPQSPQVVADQLLEAIAGWSNCSLDDPEAFDDDVTLLVVRRNDLKPRPSIGLSALAGIRIARDAIKSLVPGQLPATFPEWSVRSIGGSMLRRLNGR